MFDGGEKGNSGETKFHDFLNSRTETSALSYTTELTLLRSQQKITVTEVLPCGSHQILLQTYTKYLQKISALNIHQHLFKRKSSPTQKGKLFFYTQFYCFTHVVTANTCTEPRWCNRSVWYSADALCEMRFICLFRSSKEQNVGRLSSQLSPTVTWLRSKKL